MKRSFLLLCLYLSISVCRADNRLVDQIIDQPPGTRITLLLNLVDTSSVLRSSPQNLAELIEGVEKASAQTGDQRLRKYTEFLRRVSPTFYEDDSEVRLAVYRRAEQYFRKTGSKLMEAICLYYVGQENVILGNYGEVFESSIRSLQMMKEVGYENIPEIGRYLHGVALNYYFFRDYQTVVKIIREALEYAPYNANLDMQRYNTLALCYRNMGQSDSAACYFRKTIDLATYYQDSTWIALGSGNLGVVYSRQNQLHEALPLLLLDYQYNRLSLKSYVLARNAALALSDIWLRKNRPDSALHYLNASKDLLLNDNHSPMYGEEQREEEFLRSYYDILSQYYKSQGSYRLAHNYLDSLYQISQELDRKYSTMVAKRAEDRLSIQQYLTELALEKQQREIATTRWLWGCTALLLCTISVSLLYYLARAKQARERALRQLRESEVEAERKLTAASFERAKDKLRHQLGLLEEKNLLINRLKEELKELQSNNEVKSLTVEETIQKLMNSRLLTQEEWASFRRQFNAIFNNSLDELKHLFPDLTQSEERIYALSRLDIGTQQMASMLGIAPESVRKARYRLNKKLKNV